LLIIILFLLTAKNHTRNKKSLTSSFQPLTLQFTEGKDSSVQFDLYNVVSCKENQKEHTGSVVYICEMGTRNAGDYETKSAEDCKTLSLLFPPVQKASPPPSVTTYKGNYTCFDRSGQGRRLGPLPEIYCQHSIDITSDYGNYSASWFLTHITMRADLWWLCGDMTLRPKLPKMWRGSCALVQLVMPFYMLPTGDYGQLGTRLKEAGMLRQKRSVPGGSFDNRVYIDSIWVPRGVPGEFKARNQITAGLESLLFWWSTVNQNVDWINYIYYNQQRFVNYTRDAVKGIAEKLGPTSLTAWQNKMALDMLLAEKGGVCKMFGTFCCTFIPNNTSPDGSITKALAGLTSLSEELAENSGIKDPFSDFLGSWFGKWTVVAGILVTCGCIPCIRGLLKKLIETALTKTMYQPIITKDIGERLTAWK
uniref:Uncharacterized protein n=1 Tax=Scophthalmus maximus TaxID=52904 RepID=A0A8D3DXQ5_SCOMX